MILQWRQPTTKVETAHKLFDLFDDQLTMPMKRLGLVNLFMQNLCRENVNKIFAHMDERPTGYGQQTNANANNRHLPQEFREYGGYR
jgi:hypothetical protein